MAMKPEDYFKGLLNRGGTTVPQDHKEHFNKKLNEVKAKYATAPIASQSEVESRIKEQHADPVPKTTEQKVSSFKEKYAKLLPPKPQQS